VKLETTQIYTHVSIRTLQQVHAATHPEQCLDTARRRRLLRQSIPPAAEELFQALAEEAEEDRE